jgi:hypothetical protein
MQDDKSSVVDCSCKKFLVICWWLLIIVDVILWIWWFIVLFMIQTQTKDTLNGANYRLSHIILLLHNVNTLTLAVAYDQLNRVQLVTIIGFVFALGGDLWSLLENTQHLDQLAQPFFWRVEVGIAIWCTAVSGLSIVWFLSLWANYTYHKGIKEI